MITGKNNEYKLIAVNDLIASNMREIRPHIVESIKDNITTSGFCQTRVLSVIPFEDKYMVADGNHRLQAVKDLKIKEVPCYICHDKDLHKLGIEGNHAENTYAPMDLFDWLKIIQDLKNDKLTQAKIGEKIGWSKEMVKHYYNLLKKIDTQVLDLVKPHQNGRVSEKDTKVSFNFTEGWFRSSGLYSLSDTYQLSLLSSFINDKCHWTKSKLQKESKKYHLWEEFNEIAKSRLVDQSQLASLIDLIENNTFKTKGQLTGKIDDFNQSSKNKLMCGDCLVELSKLKDATIDIVITDSPYGIDYKSNHGKYQDSITKKGIKNDSKKKAFDLLDKTCEVLVSKTKPNAHLYFCTSRQNHLKFEEIIGKYFEIKNMIIWNKGNHGAGDLNGNWGDKYEMIIFATKGNRPMSKRKENIIEIPRIDGSKLLHPTQKPVKLFTELLQASAQMNDTICDPFMGSGSSIKACLEYGDLYYIGIELDPEIFEQAKAFIHDSNQTKIELYV